MKPDLVSRWNRKVLRFGPARCRVSDALANDFVDFPWIIFKKHVPLVAMVVKIQLSHLDKLLQNVLDHCPRKNRLALPIGHDSSENMVQYLRSNFSNRE